LLVGVAGVGHAADHRRPPHGWIGLYSLVLIAL
jgi:hypothetical protein